MTRTARVSEALDFWIGEWDCKWDGGHGTNSVDRVMNGHVVRERFRSVEPERWSGTSMSVHQAHSDRWLQTWVDSSGGYWHFESGLVDGDMAFATPEPVDAHQLYKRMVFFNIEPDHFDWRWETSADRDQWDLRWQIRYTRRSATG